MPTNLFSKEAISLYYLVIGLFYYLKMIEKASCLRPVAVERVTCTPSPFLALLFEYLWYPKNLNVGDVDKRADISHLKSGRRSVL